MSRWVSERIIELNANVDFLAVHPIEDEPFDQEDRGTGKQRLDADPIFQQYQLTK